MKRHIVWVGVDADQVLCGSNLAHDWVEQARDHGKVTTVPSGLRLQAVRADGAVLGYGAIVAVTPRGGVTTFPDHGLGDRAATVRGELRALGIGGPVTVHAQYADVSVAVAG